jgi:hypothetical protein
MRMAEAARITYTWLALSALTLLSWFLGTERTTGPRTASTAVTIGVLAIAFVKARGIIRIFMEVRTAPRWLKRACDGWMVALWATILVLYLV